MLENTVNTFNLKAFLYYDFQILKDITNRYKLLNGYKVKYVPGWDCHGTPIEQKILTDLRQGHKNMDPLDIRIKGIF